MQSDGLLWGWGRNNYGQTGTGTSSSTANVLSPVQVSTTLCTSTTTSTIHQKETLLVYPNPVGYKMFIQSPHPIHSIELFTSYGAFISKQQYSHDGITVKHVPQGVYFIRIHTAQGSEFKRFTKAE